MPVARKCRQARTKQREEKKLHPESEHLLLCILLSNFTKNAIRRCSSELIWLFRKSERMSDIEERDEGLEEKITDKTKENVDQEFPYRIDWYQTDTYVVVTVFRKKENTNEKYDVSFSENTVRITTSTDRKYTKMVHLEKTIDPNRSTWVVYPSKIEIKMKKADSSKWMNYEAKKTPDEGKPKPKNWDEFVNKIEEEKLEGEALLNKFFGDIYQKGSDEVKKAMIKSFYESGGTELNTDWSNVSKRRVEIKPPEGMEWKPWNH